MKLLTYIALLIFPACISAQNYSPFNPSVSKRFFNVDSLADDSYFFYADSVLQIGDTAHYYNYRPITGSFEEFDPENCQFWGGVVYLCDTNRFTGNIIRFNSITNTLAFSNYLSENITFDFSLGLNDSSLIYEDSSHQYWLKCSAETIETFWNCTDSVKQFTILQYDHFNNPVNSEINNYIIRLSKNHGLLSFLSVYSFPESYTLLNLMGQTNPGMGAYSIRNEDLYPYHIGDVLQYVGVGSGGSNPNGWGWLLTSYEVTSRVETPDSVIINFSYFSASQPNPEPWNGGWANYGYHMPNPLKYQKNKFYLEIPHDHKYIPSNSRPVFMNEGISTHCSVSNDNISFNERFVFYCDSCFCFGNADGHGTYINSYTAVKNIGITRGDKTAYNWQNSPNFSFWIRYFKVGNYECGTRQYLHNASLSDSEIRIYPNPAADYVIIDSPLNYNKIALKNLMGQDLEVVYTYENNIYKLSLDNLPAGGYLLSLTYENNVFVRLIIKQ